MAGLAGKPALPLATIVDLARDVFGIKATATLLPGESDQNVRLDSDDGRRFVIKVAGDLGNAGLVDAEHQAMRVAQPLCPMPVASLKGRLVEQVEIGGRRLLVRVLTWIDGEPLGRLRWRSHELLASLGGVVARFDLALSGFDHPAVHREFPWDLAVAPHTLTDEGTALDSDARAFIAHSVALHATYVAPRAAALPRQVIHNDANDYNVMVAPGHRADVDRVVVGLVDLGDMVWSARVNDVGVAAAYALLGQDDPLHALAAVVSGYHEIAPLSDDEIAVVFPLVLLRLALSMHHAAIQVPERPDDPYLAISQAPIRRALPALMRMHPRYAHYTLRQACGLDPVSHAGGVVDWIRKHGAGCAPVLGQDLGVAGAAVSVDLSVRSPLMPSDPAELTPDALGHRIAQVIVNTSGADANAVGVGGYDEARIVYTAPAFGGIDRFAETRSVHLGVDLTAPAGTPVHAPIDGTVHGVEFADTPGDYGGVVVLRHDQAGTPFFTLYGHLDRASVDTLEAGQPLLRGERFAALGAPSENGGWWPHLHFQVITDMLDVPCNVNGTARPSDRTVWKSLCPDPTPLLGLNEAPRSARRTTASLAASRSKTTGGNLRLSYRKPLHLARGWKQYLFDVDGRRYLDVYNNVPHVGHSHPAVVDAIASQLARLNTNTRYLQDVHADYVEVLLATFPAPLSVCYLTASGSEATELAVRLARARTGARDLLVLDAAYHGHTTTAIDISPYKHDGPGGDGAPDWVHTTPLPDVYRGRFRATRPDPGARYAALVGERLDELARKGRRPCGFLAETCPSVGGQLMLPAGYLPEVYRLVRAAGGLAIADEVQTGLGRIGTHFWAFEAHGVVPDIVVLGKPLGNGYPMGAVVTTREVADAFDNGMEFFSTFGGSSAACAAGLATLRVVVDEGLMSHAREVGNRLLEALRGLAERHALIGDVRGSGLFLGVELVATRDDRDPATWEADFVVNRLRECGVLTGTDGPAHNVIKIRGPMCVSSDDGDSLVAALDCALDALAP